MKQRTDLYDEMLELSEASSFSNEEEIESLKTTPNLIEIMSLQYLGEKVQLSCDDKNMT